MSWAAVAGAAVGVVGGALNNKSGSTQTVQNSIDPRIAQYLYGINGNGGLLGDVSALGHAQLAQGGLNPMQIAGLEAQRQALVDPRYLSGFEQMRHLGGGLLGHGVAGNPFTGAQQAQGMLPAPQQQAPVQQPPVQQPPASFSGAALAPSNLQQVSAATQPIQPQVIPPPSMVSAPVAQQQPALVQQQRPVGGPQNALVEYYDPRTIGLTAP